MKILRDLAVGDPLVPSIRALSTFPSRPRVRPGFGLKKRPLPRQLFMKGAVGYCGRCVSLLVITQVSPRRYLKPDNIQGCPP